VKYSCKGSKETRHMYTRTCTVSVKMDALAESQLQLIGDHHEKTIIYNSGS
jgi:hypothetical protein